jgi:hypothetical protein
MSESGVPRRPAHDRSLPGRAAEGSSPRGWAVIAKTMRSCARSQRLLLLGGALSAQGQPPGRDGNRPATGLLEPATAYLDSWQTTPTLAVGLANERS